MASVKLCGWKATPGATIACRTRSFLCAVHTKARLYNLGRLGALPQEGQNVMANSDEPKATAITAIKSTGSLAKEALIQTLKSEATTAQDVLGVAGISRLHEILGNDRAGGVIGALDALLANRRLVTLVFAVADVALIWLLIKVFRTTFQHD